MRILVLVALAGCSSQYMPRTPGRVAVTTRNGQQVYVRDGVVYESGMLGGGLRDAVAGNRAAERAAEDHHDRLVNGFIGMFAGALVVGSGAGWLVYNAAVSAESSPSKPIDGTRPAIVMVVGFAVMMAGTAYLASSEPYRWDAINIYNDNAGSFAPPPALPLAPPRPPGVSMRMRD